MPPSLEPTWGFDVTPSGVEEVIIPTHTVAIVGIAETAARLNRWEFMFTAAPLPVIRATGSPLNAIATF